MDNRTTPQLALGVACLALGIGCGPQATEIPDSSVEVEPGQIKITAEPAEFASNREGELQVELHTGDGFSGTVEYTFEPSGGLSVDPTSYSAAEDEGGVYATLKGPEGDHEVKVSAKPSSGDEQSITVKVKIGPPKEGNDE